MRWEFRSLVVVLMGISLLLTPFDCFGTTGLTRQAADCCAKGKCLPNKDSDDCCKRTAPDGRDFVTASSKVLVHVLTPVYVVAAEQCFSPVLSSALSPHFELAYSPPSSPLGSRFSLPLVI
ncbi:MAG: hypothetical protein ACR2NN_09160 [Bryobacteraceae bacterium]